MTTAVICPACCLEIQHFEAEGDLRPGVVYRCHVCRLELVIDSEQRTLALTPLGPGDIDRPHAAKHAPKLT
jgi:hypothetical protein